jgi:hypothetical protein
MALHIAWYASLCLGLDEAAAAQTVLHSTDCRCALLEKLLLLLLLLLLLAL